MKTKMLSAFMLFAFSCLLGEAAELYKGPIAKWQPVSGGKVYRFTPPESSYAEGGEVSFELSVGWRSVVQKRPDYPWSGVIVTGVANDSQGRKLHQGLLRYGARLPSLQIMRMTRKIFQIHLISRRFLYASIFAKREASNLIY